MIRPAVLADLDALVRLENVFPGDRISRKSFRHLLLHGHASVVVYDEGQGVAGNAVVLYRRGSASARIYSLVIDPARQGRGIGRALLEAAEQTAAAKGCVALHLEVRADNAVALALYEKAGYGCAGRIDGYYQDQMAAQRLRKSIDPTPTLAHSNRPASITGVSQ